MPLFVGASESYDTDAWEAYNLKKENAKLRNKARQLWCYIQSERCHIDTHVPCNLEDENYLRILDESLDIAMHELMELGIEVP